MVRSGRAGRFLGSWVVWVADHAGPVAAIGFGLALPLLWFGATQLKIDSDTGHLISDRLPWRRTFRAFNERFPHFRDELHVVVDGASPALVDDVRRRLGTELARRSDLFDALYLPGGGDFFDRHGVLYLDTDEVEELGSRLGVYSPLWRILEEDPTLGGLASVVERLAEADSTSGWDPVPFLDALTGAFFASRFGHYLSIPWDDALQGQMSSATRSRGFLLALPRLDYSRSRPAEAAIRAVREAAGRLDLDPRAVRVRITGSEAIEHESIDRGLSEVPRLMALALLLVSLILLAGLRSPRLVVASLAVLLAGLAGTTAFAAVAVGSLNMISLAFAILYVGLGIDYAIHFCLGYVEAARETPSHREALRLTAERTGVALLLSAVTTALCFYSFMVTDFTGVADLGRIGGTGMLISFIATITLLPALLSLRPFRVPGPEAWRDGAGRGAVSRHGEDGGQGAGRNPMAQLEALLARRRRPVILVALGAALVSGILIERVRFDQDVANLSDPSSESVQTYLELLDDPNNASLTVSVLAADSAAGARLADRLGRLEAVESVITLDEFVPSDQEAKLAILRRVASDLGPPPGDDAGISAESGQPRLERRLSAVERVETAAGELYLYGDSGTSAAARRALFTLHMWRSSLRRWPVETRESLVSGLEQSLVGTLPLTLARLRRGLEAGRVKRRDLPSALLERWVAADGTERIQVLPAERLDTPERLRRFVSAVRSEEPDVTGTPVNDVESARVAVRAFREAFGLALFATAAALLLLLGDPKASSLVLASLLLAGLLTGALSVLADIPFNIANIITLPLLLGVGVDAGIHMVHRRRTMGKEGASLLDTATGRAILYSALTTMAGFGDLAIARHRALAGMGGLLTIGMASVLLCTLIVLPALMAVPAAAQTKAGSRPI
jgi:hopanoid biosynthesis associated RND transporter like protein HpnN